MKLSERIDRDLTAAMKAKDASRTSVLRLVKSALKNKEIEKRRPLEEAEALPVLKALVKQSLEAIEQFEAGGRVELAKKERQEKAVIESYLPEAVSDEEMGKVVVEVIQALSARGPKDVGAVMKEAMARLAATGKSVDGKAVNALVRARLQE